MTAADLVLVVAVIAAVVAAGAAVLASGLLIRELRTTRRLSRELSEVTQRLAGELEHTVVVAGHEVERVDSLLTAAEDVQDTVAEVSQLTRDTVATPLIKARAFFAGTSRAARRMRRAG